MSVECAFARTRMAAVAASKSCVRAKLSRLVLLSSMQTRAAERAFMFPHRLIWHLPTFRAVSPIPHNLLGRCPLPV
jgi:hypothetical protein